MTINTNKKNKFQIKIVYHLQDHKFQILEVKLILIYK